MLPRAVTRAGLLATFDSPTRSLCHTLSHISGPSKVCHTYRTPQFLVVHAYIHTCLYRGFVLVRGGFGLGVCLGIFCLEAWFRPGWLLSVSPSVLSILGFICMKFFKSVT